MDYPLVTLAIITYRQERFIKETLKGAISQDYPNLEIVISDDSSPDDTFEIIRHFAETYNGPHRLIINRNNLNLGLVGHVNKVLSELTHGEYVMLSGGDDICLSDTISTAIRTLIDYGLNSVACNMIKIDGNSRMLGLFYDCRTDGVELYSLKDYIRNSFKTSGACRIFKREIYKVFGPFLPECPTEDSPNLLRSFLYGGVGYLFRPNIMYRIHESNISGFVSLMTRFDPQRIHSQYIHDLKTAFGRGLICQSDYQLIEEKLTYWLKRQIALREIYGKKTFLKRMVTALSVALKKGFSLKDAKSYCLQVLGWRTIEAAKKYSDFSAEI